MFIELSVENQLLRKTAGQAKLAERFMFLEQSFLEEQLLTKDLRKKLHGVNKRNATLELKVRKLELELTTYKQGSPRTPTSAMIRLSVQSDLARERSHSMNDLSERAGENRDETDKVQQSGTISPHNGFGSVKRLK